MTDRSNATPDVYEDGKPTPAPARRGFYENGTPTPRPVHLMPLWGISGALTLIRARVEYEASAHAVFSAKYFMDPRAGGGNETEDEVKAADQAIERVNDALINLLHCHVRTYAELRHKVDAIYSSPLVDDHARDALPDILEDLTRLNKQVGPEDTKAAER